jgi:hypothetical protein
VRGWEHHRFEREGPPAQLGHKQEPYPPQLFAPRRGSPGSKPPARTFKHPARRVGDDARARVERDALQRQRLVPDALEHQLRLVLLKFARAHRHKAACRGLKPRALHAQAANRAVCILQDLHWAAVELKVQLAVSVGPRLRGSLPESGARQHRVSVKAGGRNPGSNS